jgi:hypothetical protein
MSALSSGEVGVRTFRDCESGARVAPSAHGHSVSLKMPRPLLLALAAVLIGASAFGQPATSPVVYNNMDGDGGVALDRSIKQAYSGKYTIVDTSSSAGYAEPTAIAGDLPRLVKDRDGTLLVGYVLVAYIVTADGVVSDPVIIKWDDERLCRAALDIMAGWRFKPGTLKGLAVATTAAQEFNFGPDKSPNGLKMERVVVYQPNDVMMRRMAPKERTKAYIDQMENVAHNFFVGDTVKETFSIVVITRPGRRARVWFVSSVRPGDSPELAPLKRLLEGVPAMDVHGGPVVLGMTGLIAGGDGKDQAMGESYHNPIPAEWQQASDARKDPVPVASDAFIDLVWPDAP